MDLWRRAARESRIERIRNTEIRRMMHAERTIIDGIDHRRLKWYGHLRKMKDGEYQRLYIHGKLKEETEEEDRELRGIIIFNRQ